MKRRALAWSLRRQVAWPCVVVAILVASPAHAEHLTPAQRASLDLGTYRPDTMPPAFTARTLDDRPVSLDELRGKVILVNFWATWCRECHAEMPAFERLHRKYGARGLAMLAINVREDTEVVRRYRRDRQLTFPIALDPHGKVNALYGVIGLPTTFLIARDGRAVALAIGLRRWDSAAAEAIIEALLSDHASRPAAP